MALLGLETGLELSQLRYFVAVAEHENISRAAAQLRIAQPAVSRQIRNLELELGQTLLQRTERGVVLTASGRAYHGAIKAILKRLDEANETIRRCSDFQPVLHIGVVQLVQSYPLITDLIARYRESHPDVPLEGSHMPSRHQPEALLRGEIDLAIGVLLGPLPDGLESIELFRVERGLILSKEHPLARGLLTQEAIDAFPLITTSRNTWPVNTPFLHARDQAQFKREFAETFDNMALLLDRLHDHRSIAIIPDPGPVLTIQGLVFRAFEPIRAVLPVAMSWRAGAREPALRDFLQSAAVVIEARRRPA